MKQFIISILTWIGLGINGKFTTTENTLFFDRFKDYSRGCSIKVVESTDTTAKLLICNEKDEKDCFNIIYTFDAVTKRITNIEIEY